MIYVYRKQWRLRQEDTLSTKSAVVKQSDVPWRAQLGKSADLPWCTVSRLELDLSEMLYTYLTVHLTAGFQDRRNSKPSGGVREQHLHHSCSKP